MDPNETLNAIREAIQGIDRSETPVESDEWAASLVEHVNALDEWLTRGGFLPSDWERKSSRYAILPERKS